MRPSTRAPKARTLAPGRRFKPYDVANPFNIFGEQVIVEIAHTAHDRSYATNDEGEPEYQNTFTVMYGRPLAGKVFFGAFGEWIGAVMYTASVLQRLGCGPRC